MALYKGLVITTVLWGCEKVEKILLLEILINNNYFFVMDQIMIEFLTCF